MSLSANAWGEHTVTNYTTANIGNISPFRYRGYYFDTETGFYYLNARYYDPQTKRFINADHINYLGANGDINAFNLYAYCSNNPVMYVDSTGKFRTKANPIKEIKQITGKKDLNPFGYELRSSAGWKTSPNMASGFWGRIGFSSYITYTEGQSGVFYAFAGGTIDEMNWFGQNYYAGIGINLFDIVGIELQLEAIGAGAKISIGDWEFGINVNLAGATSIALAVNEDLGDGYTKTTGFTMGVNTGLGVSIIATLCKGVYTGDFSPIIVPCP